LIPAQKRSGFVRDREVSMDGELEKRIETLEQEMSTLKGEIRETLLDVQANVTEDPANHDVGKWQKGAWGLALLNLILAIILFTNAKFEATGPFVGELSVFGAWLRAFWIALALVWLILQLYPLALLLGQVETRSRDIAWRSTLAIVRSNPGAILGGSLVIFFVTIISTWFPSLWLIAAVICIVVVCVNSVNYLWRRHFR